MTMNSEPRTREGRDMLDHAVQYNPADADKAVTGAKIAAVEDEARVALLSELEEAVGEKRGYVDPRGHLVRDANGAFLDFAAVIQLIRDKQGRPEEER